MTLADHQRPLDQSSRPPRPDEEAALINLIAVTAPAFLRVPPGVDREERAWQRLLAKSEFWNLPPRMTAERLTRATVLGLAPDW